MFIEDSEASGIGIESKTICNEFSTITIIATTLELKRRNFKTQEKTN